jgi:hypothetical protein
LNASTVGGRCVSGSARAKTPSGSANRPFDGTDGNTGGGGPCARVNTRSKFSGALISCTESTGRFWVTLWPNSEPKTPRS